MSRHRERKGSLKLMRLPKLSNHTVRRVSVDVETRFQGEGLEEMVDDKSNPPGMTTVIVIFVEVVGEVVPDDASEVNGNVIVESKHEFPYLFVSFALVAGLTKEATDNVCGDKLPEYWEFASRVFNAAVVFDWELSQYRNKMRHLRS